ncbi:hypothetical protein SLEP1_g6315 [Rubroshorea leprosula]|uniref:Uncharacterized protein n=1 Tax=Rubroshorea leprosula TaxID=152421 RepID=A0AAV5I158_9ROSI|nr:hypothetical protein SLEP1_g6315 [Rubroshorea leprosula]
MVDSPDFLSTFSMLYKAKWKICSDERKKVSKGNMKTVDSFPVLLIV